MIYQFGLDAAPPSSGFIRAAYLLKAVGGERGTVLCSRLAEYG